MLGCYPLLYRTSEEALYTPTKTDVTRFNVVNEAGTRNGPIRKRSYDWEQAQLRAAEKRFRRRFREENTNIRRDAILVEAPATLSFSQNSVETVRFFDQLKQAIFTDRIRKKKGEVAPKGMLLRLNKVKYISLPCAVILSAELKRWTLKFKGTPNLVDYGQWSGRVRSLLVNLGTLKHLGVSKKSYKRYSKSTVRGQAVLVELTSAVVQDGEKVSALQDKLMALAEFFEPKPYIFRALLEATNNAIEHAYEGEDTLKFPNVGGGRWYATASYDPAKDALRFFVYDQGIGIPASLQSKDRWSHAIRTIREKFGYADHDTDTIDAAFEIGRTRTHQDERGKGLMDMLNVLQAAKSGYIRVISGRGDYTVDAGGDMEKRQHSSHIGGTLVEWCIPYSAFKSEETSNG